MLERLKAKRLFEKLLKRPKVEKAYAMVPPSDSWYDTIVTVHNSLEEIHKLPHSLEETVSCDNLKLKAVYYPGEKGNVTVICVHGYTSHAEREWAFPGLFYHSLGYNVLVPYQRAHGLSEGKYITFGALESSDLEKWVEKINQINPKGKIVLHGLSMGGGIVLDVANKSMPNVKCLIADAPSLGIDGFFRNVSREFFRKNPDKIYRYCVKRFNKQFGVDVSNFDGLKIVADGKYPLLLAAGSNERLEEVFEQIKTINPQPTETVILSGCSHGNGMYKQTETFQTAIKAFVQKYV